MRLIPREKDWRIILKIREIGKDKKEGGDQITVERGDLFR